MLIKEQHSIVKAVNMKNETTISMLERMYRSRLGRIMSLVVRKAALLHTPFMVYGYFDYPSKAFRKFTRISSMTTVINKRKLSMGDNVWVGHYTILDASNSLKISEGCQIAAWVGIFTHGSQDSIRLLGRDYVDIPNTERRGYVRKNVEIGPYTFIGSGSVVLPGVKIGKGSIIGVGTLVRNDVPDYSIVFGTPGKVIGTTIDLDRSQVSNHEDCHTYYDPGALDIIKGKITQEIV